MAPAFPLLLLLPARPPACLLARLPVRPLPSLPLPPHPLPPHPHPLPTAHPPAAPSTLLQAGQNLLEGYIRTGCTQLTVNALMPVGRLAGLQKRGLGAMVGDLLAGDGASDVLDQDMLVQVRRGQPSTLRRPVTTSGAAAPAGRHRARARQ